MYIFEYVAHYCRILRVICKNGKNQTFITQYKVTKDSDKRTVLDTQPTSYVFKNSTADLTALICTVARRHVFL